MCRTWRIFFTNTYFYRVINFKPIATRLTFATSEFFDFLIQRCHHSVRLLDISNLPHWPSSFTFPQFLKGLQCNQLTSLLAENCFILDDESIQFICSTQQEIENVRLEGCYKLSDKGYGQLKNLPNLKNLSLRNIVAPIPKQILYDLLCSGKIEALEIVGLFTSPRISDINQVAWDLPNVLLKTQLSNLKYLNVDLGFSSFHSWSNSLRIRFLKRLLSHLPAIEYFNRLMETRRTRV